MLSPRLLTTLFRTAVVATTLPLAGASETATAGGLDLEAYRELIDQAKADFRPITPEAVDEARDEMADAAHDLEEFLIPGSRRGDAWLRYLRWQGVQESLAVPGEVDLVALRATLDRFGAGADGVQLPPLRNTADAMQRYFDLASIARARDQQVFVHRQLDLLADYLERYASDKSSRARFEIERRLELLTSIGQAEALTAALHRDFGSSNVRVALSERFVRRAAERPIDDVGPVRDCILGTTIRGTGYTTGTATAELVAADRRAAIVLRLEGVTRSETHGYNSPVVIRSSGTTPFTATKRIELEDENFWNYPTKVTATTSTVTRSVRKQGGGFGSGLVERIGAKKVAEKKPRANYIAARHAEERIANSFEDELLPKLQDARYEYLEQFKKPFALRDAEPSQIHFSSTDDSLHVEMLQAARGELGADTAPPEFSSSHDLTVRLHETGAANLAAALVGGATLSQDTKEGNPKLDVELPQWMRDAIDEAREEAETEPAEDDDREFKPWSLLFRRLRPVTLEFADGMVKIRLHATRITAGDDVYDGWDILVDYGLQVQDGGLLLVRDGDIEVIPTAFDPVEGDSLTNRQVGLRGNLARELNRQADAGRGFPEEIEIPMIDLPEAIKEVGPLMLEDATSDEAWLSLGWKLP